MWLGVALCLGHIAFILFFCGGWIGRSSLPSLFCLKDKSDVEAVHVDCVFVLGVASRRNGC